MLYDSVTSNPEKVYFGPFQTLARRWDSEKITSTRSLGGIVKYHQIIFCDHIFNVDVNVRESLSGRYHNLPEPLFRPRHARNRHVVVQVVVCEYFIKAPHISIVEHLLNQSFSNQLVLFLALFAHSIPRSITCLRPRSCALRSHAHPGPRRRRSSGRRPFAFRSQRKTLDRQAQSAVFGETPGSMSHGGRECRYYPSFESLCRAFSPAPAIRVWMELGWRCSHLTDERAAERGLRAVTHFLGHARELGTVRTFSLRGVHGPVADPLVDGHRSRRHEAHRGTDGRRARHFVRARAARLPRRVLPLEEARSLRGTGGRARPAGGVTVDPTALVSGAMTGRSLLLSERSEA